MEHKPLKRHKALIPLSKDHHLGLLLSWKIRTGFRKGLSLNRINAYTVHFFKRNLIPHFKIEEAYVFTCLPEDNPLRKEAEQQHEQLYAMADKLMEVEVASQDDLSNFEQLLVKHIRFEERELFMHIQDQLQENELQALARSIEAMHDETPEQWEDPFWI